MPIATTLLVIFLLVVCIWFLRGGSFRLYASIVFTLYHLTGQIWSSVILLGIVQNIVFIPLHMLGNHFANSIEDFENELKKIKTDEQYLLFKRQVKEGNLSIIFYILNFVINAVAFLSAGRIFLIDFYNQKLDPNYLYSFVHYPDYPLRGTDFKLPFFEITGTMALSWPVIGKIFLIIGGIAIIPTLVWRIVRPWLESNHKILKIRIGRNRIKAAIGGMIGVFSVALIWGLRHIPTGVKGVILTADLTVQNTTMNTVTAIGTFITTIYFGWAQNQKAEKIAKDTQIPSEIIKKISLQNVKNIFRNGVILGLGAFFLTNQIPCAFELSVATFEAIAILSPLTLDKLGKRATTDGNRFGSK